MRKPTNLDRDFSVKTTTTPVLVEFGHKVSPATTTAMPPDSSLLTRLKEISGRDPVPVFKAETVRGSIYVAGAPIPEPSFAHFVEVPADSTDRAVALSEEIRAKMPDDVVDAIPVPVATPAIGPEPVAAAAMSPPTPDFRAMQGYLGPAPMGVNAEFAWQFPGGDGFGITVIDIEGGWRLTHESLVAVRFNHWGGRITDGNAWLEHGTAAVGLLASPSDRLGTTGVCPGAKVGMVSAFEAEEPSEQKVASQILKTAQLLQAGDVMLIELQRPGPLTKFVAQPDQKGYVPMDYWPDVRAAVQRAVARGICVVEVAGNGGVDLDDPSLGGRFDRKTTDSGSIMVAAGAPPTPQVTFGEPRSRLEFSNYGWRIDCQGWGQLVTTAGYGDLWIAGEDVNRSYTSSFMGTSSAAPIVAGVIACLQGRHKLVYGVPLSPFAIRYALNVTGSAQSVTAGTYQRVGNLPNLVELFQFFGLLR